MTTPARPAQGGDELLIVKESTRPKIIVTESTRPKLDPAEVAKALGAKPVPVKVPEGAGPLNLFAVRQELYRRLQSSGGRPGLPDTDKVAKVPVSEVHWKRLEELAAAMAAPGFSPSAGQVANVLLTWALENLGPEAIKELTAKTGEPGAHQ
jgi:hypothetical protein